MYYLIRNKSMTFCLSPQPFLSSFLLRPNFFAHPKERKKKRGGSRDLALHHLLRKMCLFKKGKDTCCVL